MPVGIVHPARSQAYRFILVQFGLGLLVVLGSGVIAGLTVANSTLLGVLVATLANACFAKHALARMGASIAKQVARNFYKAQIIKTIISVVLFIACFSYPTLQPVAFFSGYISVQLSLWLAPRFLNTARHKANTLL